MDVFVSCSKAIANSVNIALQYFYKVLQALALEEEVPEKGEDKTMPRYKQIFKRTSEQVIDWKEELEQCWAEYQGSKPATTLASRSLKRESEDDGRPSKRVKPEPMTDAEMRGYHDKSKLDKVSSTILRKSGNGIANKLCVAHSASIAGMGSEKELASS
jgi:ATP-dependent DNA helicase 2 subunit 1